MTRTRSKYFALVAVFLSPMLANADIIETSGPHATYNSIPFSLSSGNGRYQQVFDSDLFSSLAAIQSIAFSSASADFAANVSVSLGLTAANSATGLSTNFDDNVFGSLTSVFSGAVSLSGMTVDPSVFDMIFGFDTSFVYDPFAGYNLLVDFVMTDITAGVAVSRMDSGFGSARAYDNQTFFGADNVALRTQFSTTAVPEPGTLALLGIGLLGIGAARRRDKA